MGSAYTGTYHLPDRAFVGWRDDIPWYLPTQASPLLISMLGRNPDCQPYGVQKFHWNPGESDFHYLIGGQRYNVLFAGTLLDEDGRVHSGTPPGDVFGGMCPAHPDPVWRLNGARRH